MLRCQVQSTKKIRRIINNNGKVLERIHFDKTINCECGDDDDPNPVCPLAPAKSSTQRGAESGGGVGGGGSLCIKGLGCWPYYVKTN